MPSEVVMCLLPWQRLVLTTAIVWRVSIVEFLQSIYIDFKKIQFWSLFFGVLLIGYDTV